jgi:hypothetical protein
MKRKNTWFFPDFKPVADKRGKKSNNRWKKEIMPSSWNHC